MSKVLLLCNIIRVFFDTHTLSDVNDVDTMEDLAIVLSTFDWKKLQSEVGNWWGNLYRPGSRFALAVFSWLHRQLASKRWT